MTPSKIVYDLGSLPEWIAALSSVAGTIVVSLGVLVAFRGLNTWREQRLSGKKIDIAEESVRGFARIKDIIIHASNGAVGSNEINEICESIPGSYPQNERERTAAYIAPSYRLKKHGAELDEFLNNKYLVGAYFGQRYVDLYDEISEIIKKIHAASHMLADHCIRHEESGEMDTSMRIFWEEQRQKIWMGSNPEHPLHIELLSTVDIAVAAFGLLLRDSSIRKK